MSPCSRSVAWPGSVTRKGKKASGGASWPTASSRGASGCGARGLCRCRVEELHLDSNALDDATAEYVANGPFFEPQPGTMDHGTVSMVAWVAVIGTQAQRSNSEASHSLCIC